MWPKEESWLTTIYSWLRAQLKSFETDLIKGFGCIQFSGSVTDRCVVTIHVNEYVNM